MSTKVHKPGVHGRDHSPTGPDTVYTGEWVVTNSNIAIPGAGWWTGGSTINPATGLVVGGAFVPRMAPDLLGTWANIGGGVIATRFRLSIGPMNLVDRDGLAVTRHANKQVEIQIAVDGGEEGSDVFDLPPEFWKESDDHIPLVGYDSAGQPKAFHVRLGRTVTDGPPV